MREHQYLYVLASEAELNNLVSGRRHAGKPVTWPFVGRGLRQPEGHFGVLWKDPNHSPT